MVQPHFKTIDAETWRLEMLSFFCRCTESKPSEQSKRIREACDLFRQVPEDLGVALLAPAEEERVEFLTLSGAAESAVLALVGPDAGFMLSRGTNGSHLATVVLPEQTQDYSATGSTVALALLAALTAAVLAEAGQLDVFPVDPPCRGTAGPGAAIGK